MIHTHYYSSQGKASFAVLVFPFASQSTVSFAKKFAQVVARVGTKTYLVVPNHSEEFPINDNLVVCNVRSRMHYINQIQPLWFSVTLWIFKCFVAQLELAREVYRLRNQVDIVICTLGQYYQFPILIAHLCRLKVVKSAYGDSAIMMDVNYEHRVLIKLLDLVTEFNYRFSHAILVESSHRHSVSKYADKCLNGALYVENRGNFAVHPEVSREPNLVGFIGRFSKEKGLRELLQAIPIALERQPDLRFLLIGQGGLDAEVKHILTAHCWSSRVTWLHWVDHKQVPVYLNRLSLLVMPSYAEGLPNLALEALACETPLLATDVGALRDLIVEGETGFLLSDNSPVTIANAIVNTVKKPNLDKVASCGRVLVEREYSLQASINRFLKVTDSLLTER